MIDEKLFKRVHTAAKYSFQNYDFEAIAQEALLEFHKKGKGQSVKHALIDAFRKIYGRNPEKLFLNTVKDSENRPELKFYELELNARDDFDQDFEYRYDVSYSRNSQLRNKYKQEFINRKIWEHYKEYGCSEINIDWITL